jgi:import inner membrane translocase subunit TIM50
MRGVISASSVLLSAIAAEKVEDVRDVLDYYQQFSNPVEAFRENQRKLLVMGSVKERNQAISCP